MDARSGIKCIESLLRVRMTDKTHRNYRYIGNLSGSASYAARRFASPSASYGFDVSTSGSAPAALPASRAGTLERIDRALTGAGAAGAVYDSSDSEPED